MSESKSELWLIRHGETEWSLSGAHTGKSEIGLTNRGRQLARRVRDYLAGRRFALVLTSPRQRARETCRLAGYGNIARVDEALSEWNYGLYEGRTTEQIQKDNPGWSLWRDGVPNGETICEVAQRAQYVIARSLAAQGPVALFAHGHILRILTACWLDLPPEAGRLFALGTAGISTLGFERNNRVICTWNLPVEQSSEDLHDMPNESNQRATEMHNIASHKHEVGAVQKEKQEHLSAHEMSRKALDHSVEAHEREQEALTAGVPSKD